MPHVHHLTIYSVMRHRATNVKVDTYHTGTHPTLGPAPTKFFTPLPAEQVRANLTQTQSQREASFGNMRKAKLAISMISRVTEIWV